jgi:protein TonB
MKRNIDKVPEFDEIIFENRNKEYGAYVLRKKYAASTLWSVLGAVTLFTLMVILFSAFSSRDSIAETGGGTIVIIQTDSTITDPNKLRQEEPQKLPETPERIILGPPEVTNDSLVITQMLTADEMSDSVKNTPVTKDDSLVYIPESDPAVATEPEIPYFLEEMPVFPGGQEALMRFIGEKINYPEEAAVNGIQGRVTVQFVVWKDGTVKMIEVLKGVDPLLDKEATRVITMMPKWKPGKQNGEPASVKFVVPVYFRLENR